MMMSRKTISFNPSNNQIISISPTLKDCKPKDQLLPSEVCVPYETPASKLEKEKRSTFVMAKNAFAEIFETTKD